jgi:hypothetical protein
MLLNIQTQNNKDEIIGFIYKTSDLTKFKTIFGNRDVDKNHVKEIKESIKQFTYIGESIIVNEKFEVIDGQHRLEACKQLQAEGENNVFIHYSIKEGYGQDEMVIVNTNSKDWNIDTHIASQATRGNESYQFILDAKKDFNMCTNVFVEMLNIIKVNSGDKSSKKTKIKKTIQDGTFDMEIEEQDEMIIYLNLIRRFHNYLYGEKKAINIYHIQGYLKLFFHKDFDMKHFENMLNIDNEKQRDKALSLIQNFQLMNPSNREDLILQLIEIYNTKKNKKDKLNYDRLNKRIYKNS